MILLFKLLDMFRCRATSAGFEKAATVHERHNRKHLRACAKFQDWEEVGQVVAQDVTGDRDRVLASSGSFQGERRSIGHVHDSYVKTVGVMIGEVTLNLDDELGIMGPFCIEPKHCRPPGRPAAVDRKLDPVLNR